MCYIKRLENLKLVLKHDVIIKCFYFRVIYHTSDAEIPDAFTEIFSVLADNDIVFCRRQQRDETDITREEKVTILTDVYNRSKSGFLSRFGQFLNSQQIRHFEQFKNDPTDGYEIMHHLKRMSKLDSKQKRHRFLRNKRYAALKRLEKDSYFSETEMMKRNPLLYEQLVGQYLSSKEKKIRDRRSYEQSKTFVGVLLDGIDKEQMERKKKDQAVVEGTIGVDESSDSSWDDDEASCSTSNVNFENKPRHSLWGEMPEDESDRVKFDLKIDVRGITAQERSILREEFVSIMHQNFLDGKDEEFDYEAVDNNEEYDNLEILEHDEEEMYFDSEEPEDMTMESENNKTKEESSEDELDMYMNALNQHPAVCQLSEHIKKL